MYSLYKTNPKILEDFLHIDVEQYIELMPMDIQEEYNISKDETIEEIIAKLTDEMLKYATNMEFEKAAELRDKIKELKKLIS